MTITTARRRQAKTAVATLSLALTGGLALVGCGAPTEDVRPTSSTVTTQAVTSAPTTTTSKPTTTAPVTMTTTAAPITTTVAPAAVTVDPAPAVVVAPEPVVAAPAPVAPAPAVVPEVAANASYANCTEVKAAGAAPIYAGDPGFLPKFDRDNDGVGCES